MLRQEELVGELVQISTCQAEIRESAHIPLHLRWIGRVDDDAGEDLPIDRQRAGILVHEDPLPDEVLELVAQLLGAALPCNLEPIAINTDIDRYAAPTRHLGRKLPPDSVGIPKESVSLANSRSTRDRETLEAKSEPAAQLITLQHEVLASLVVGSLHPARQRINNHILAHILLRSDDKDARVRGTLPLCSPSDGLARGCAGEVQLLLQLREAV
eukprot:8972259-Pyramimonas_sp.AAC.1